MRVSKNEKTGQSKGFCYVAFEEHEMAKTTLLKLNNRELEGVAGRKLKIDFKQSKAALENLYKINPSFKSKEPKKKNKKPLKAKK